ncbi:MAG TPA: hypothetical protein VH475_28260 [Tepidisphaeraceae bacterium]|jgi:hypothetical protein
MPETPRPDPALNHLQLLRAHTRPLTPTQLSAIDLLLTGRSDATVAAILNLHRTTVTRWRLYSHVFQAEFNRRRQEVYSAASDKLRATLAKAIRVFQKQVRSDDQKVAFRAARALLQLAGNSRLALPPDPALFPPDPTGVLELEARKVHVELASIDPRIDPIHDAERALALRRLLHKNCNDPLDPPHHHGDNSTNQEPSP